MLAVLFVARTAMGFQFQSIASTAIQLTEFFGIGFAEIGTLIGLYMLPGIVIALPGGLLGRRFGDKVICAAALALMSIGGLLVGMSDTYPGAFAGRLCSGVGAVLFNLVLTKMATDWFIGREINTAMGAILGSWPFGIALGLLTQGAVADLAGWQTVMFGTAALCGVALLLMTALYRSPGKAGTSAPSSGSYILSAGEFVPTIIAGALWGFFNVGLVLFFSFAPVLFIEQMRSNVEASAMASIGLWVSIITVPLGGYVVDRLGHPDRVIVLFSMVTAAALAALPLGIVPAMFCLIFGAALGPPAGAILALPSRVLRPENRAVGLGYFYTVYYIAMAFGPALAGYLRDVFGTASASILLGAAFFGMALPMIAAFHWSRRATRESTV
jgi:MFS family permease